MTPPRASRMTPQERRASLALAAIFALRMLGLFLVLPVFALEARKYPGGDDAARVGLALGLYGLTQALLQLPLGLASDRFGRKRVIVAGMLVFALGSVLAALADSLHLLMWGRALQGAGAVSAASMALLADVTRDAVRTKAMAMVGASIGASFSLALVIAPMLAAWGGLPGIFALTALMALLAIAMLLWSVPTVPTTVPPAPAPCTPGAWRELLHHGDLLRLNAGAFALHLVQTAMWVAVPLMLVRAGLEKPQHWRIYLLTVLLSFGVLALLFALERRGYMRRALLGAIALVGAAQLGLAWLAGQAAPPALWSMAFCLWVFFCGFNALEASQPSQVSRLAPPHLRGAAMGAYGTLQSLGLFAGGALGGVLAQRAGPVALFAATAGLAGLWLWLAWPMQPAARHA